MKNFNLRDVCHVCVNNDDDNFVGIKVDAEKVAVHFPLGYQLPSYTENERELRRDIIHLIRVLATFSEQKERLIAEKKYHVEKSADFPINAYLSVITDFINRSYYTEIEQSYNTSDSGKINWHKTLRKHQPIIQQNGSPIYTEFEVRRFTPNNSSLITRIHEFCVFDAFQKLGWLFSTVRPRKPQLQLASNKRMYIGVIRDKMGKTFIDKDRLLFQSMIDMLNSIDEESPQNRLFYGTTRFEYVWEKMVDRAFGIKNKKDFFPRTYWRYLKNSSGLSHENDALEPDTIMIPTGMDKAFVLDAKYYRFGVSGNPSHLPPSSSINKQITYGEYVNTLPRFTGRDTVYNAFLMPYNRTKYKGKKSDGGVFESGDVIESVGEAYGDWKTRGYSYESVQGIVVDTRYLMTHYSRNTAQQAKILANKILTSYEHHRELDISAEYKTS